MNKDELFDKLECAPYMIHWSWQQPCTVNLKFVESCVEWNVRNSHIEEVASEDQD